MKTDRQALRKVTDSGAAAPVSATAPPIVHRGMLGRVVGGVLSRLAGLRGGQLVFVDGDMQARLGVQVKGQAAARIEVRDPEFWWAVALRGSVGAGESYGSGHWSTPDLTAVVRLLSSNLEVTDQLEGGLARATVPALKLYHRLRSNSRDGARRNISAHYDLGNEFFDLLLDETMMYSAGIYESETSSLHEAQLAKLRRIGRKLRLGPEDHLLEIGTGWGGMALLAAEEFGCRVTTTTISERQHERAVERIRAAGLEERVTVLFQDYRDLRGEFTKLVSIEMVEAIGWRQYPSYLVAISRLLRSDGLALVQAITIQDHRFERAKRSVDFIQRHIFPGSCIPSIAALTAAMAKHSDLRLAHLEDLTPHYARTLRDWRENLTRNAAGIRRLGHDEEFLRIWEFYLCYCEGGFQERAIHDVHLLFAKPGDRTGPLLPSL